MSCSTQLPTKSFDVLCMQFYDGNWISNKEEKKLVSKFKVNKLV